MIPDNLHIGPIPIHIFGLCLAVALLAAGKIAALEFERKGFDPEVASQALVWAAVAGIAGSRLWVVVERFGEFLERPLDFLLTGEGFVFYGGLLGGAAAVTLLFRRRGIPWLQGADAVAPALAVGQAIGRVGCQLSGDGDWGAVTTVPWGMAYPHAVVGWPYPPGVVVHPTPVYETILYTLTFAILWRLRRRPHVDGAIIGWYLVLSAVARFVVEFWRIEPVVAVGLTSAQLMAFVLVPAGVALALRRQAWRTAAA